MTLSGKAKSMGYAPQLSGGRQGGHTAAPTQSDQVLAQRSAHGLVTQSTRNNPIIK